MAAPVAIARPNAAHHNAGTKLRATLAAHLALAGGFVLHDLGDGAFEISRWGRTLHCADLAAVQTFLDRLGTRRSQVGDTRATP